MPDVRNGSPASGWFNSKEAICLAIIAATFLFYILTIRAGQPWPDDFAMYIREAKSFADHTSLGQTGYIYNPYNAGLGPRLYPPVFPALLVPAYKIGGLSNLGPMQVEIVIFFAGILITLWLSLGRGLPLHYRAAMLAIIGFNPLLWAYKDLITSDIPFTFFLFVTFALAQKFTTAPVKSPKDFWRSVLLAALVYLCYGIRTMGILLIPAFLLLAALYWKRGGRVVAAAAAIGLLPCAIQMKFFGGEASYADQLKLGPLGFLKTVFRNIITYGWSLSNFWDNPYSKIFRDTVLAAVTLLALTAYIRRLRTPSIYEVFLPIYLAVVLLWPNPAGARYLIPMFPLYVYYALAGMLVIAPWVRLRSPEPVFVPLLLLIALSYGTEFATAAYGPFPDGMSNGETKALFAFVRSNTTTSDVFVFRRPRAFALFTGRNAAVYPEPKYASDFSSYFHTIGATYVVEAPSMDDAIYDQFLDRDCLSKRLVFSDSQFRLFRLNPTSLEACNSLPLSPTNALLSNLAASAAP